MQDEVLKPLFRLLNRNDVMPHSNAVIDLETVLGWIEDQEDEAGMRHAANEIRDAMVAAALAQPGAYL